MKKLCCVVLICVSVFTFQGCINSSSYNDMSDSEEKWIAEQVKAGNITEAEAKELLWQKSRLEEYENSRYHH